MSQREEPVLPEIVINTHLQESVDPGAGLASGIHHHAPLSIVVAVPHGSAKCAPGGFDTLSAVV